MSFSLICTAIMYGSGGDIGSGGDGAGKSAAEHTGARRNGRGLSGGGLDFLLGDIQSALWFSFLTAMTDANLTLGNQSKGEKIFPILGCKGLSSVGWPKPQTAP